VLERPFYTHAGVGRWAVWYSLRADFASLLVGYRNTLTSAGIAVGGVALAPSFLVPAVGARRAGEWWSPADRAAAERVADGPHEAA
jgi:hypothetical protein